MPRVLGACAEPEEAEARHQHDAGQGIVHCGAAGARFVACEIAPVVADERLRRLVAAFLKSSSLPASGAGTISGQGLVRMTWSGVITPARA